MWYKILNVLRRRDKRSLYIYIHIYTNIHRYIKNKTTMASFLQKVFDTLSVTNAAEEDRRQRERVYLLHN